MIPNTDINCGKCAAPIYSDCVMWAGGDLTCLKLTQDCCDVSLTQVINTLGGYICNFSYISGYTIPVCLSSYNITDFKGMQQAMLTQICNLQSEIGSLNFNWNCYTSGTTVLSSVTLAIQKLIDQTCARTNLNLTWNCIPSGTTNSINDSLQAIINNVNGTNQYTFANSQFYVTGETSCSSQVKLIIGSWVDITSGCTFYNGFSSSRIEYLKDVTGVIHLRGTIVNPGSIVLSGSTGGSGTPTVPYTVTNVSSYTYAGSGPSIPVVDLPSFLGNNVPNSSYFLGTIIGFNNNFSYGRGSNVTQYYNIEWNIAIGFVNSSSSVPACQNASGTGVRINVYVPYEATQGSGSSVSMYLGGLNYSLI